MSNYRTTPDHDNAGWPPGVPYIVGNEACERFSFYGMRAILQVHLTTLFAAQMLVAETAAAAKSEATQVYHLFVAGVYAFPMIGALVAAYESGGVSVDEALLAQVECSLPRHELFRTAHS